MPAPLEDDLGIVYLIENAQQFWSELEDILHIPNDANTTLSSLDSSLQRFLAFCATYHEQYLQSPLQLQHACDILLDSELFAFHSERMCEILIDKGQSNTNPHSQLILYNVLLFHGRRHSNFFRSTKRWHPLLPLLMDHVLVEIDPDVEDTYFGSTNGAGGGSSGLAAIPVPIEAKLRSLGVRLLYEVCRVQKLGVQDLRIFDDSFIDYLFDLVEQTRNMQDETFNYSVIKLIVALNEQFMVASLNSTLDASLQTPDLTLEHPQPRDPSSRPSSEDQNRVLRILMRRLGSTKTFGENMIFMLNRANRTAEDTCMQLLVLKILYLLFTNNKTSEYFYTNDLCVLVDVFLREVVDLDEDSEALRHTYLRVLHPLLTKTQLRTIPYKRPQIVCALEGLIENGYIRDINPTTKRLVERCLGGEWCVQLRGTKPANSKKDRVGSPASDIGGTQSLFGDGNVPPDADKGKGKTVKARKSAEHLVPTPTMNRGLLKPLPHNESALCLAAATPPKRKEGREMRKIAGHLEGTQQGQSEKHTHYSHGENGYHSTHSASTHVQHPNLPSSATSLPLPSPKHVNPVSLPLSPSHKGTSHRRMAPPTPAKRRKPPAVPVRAATSAEGVTMTAIKSSASKGMKVTGV